MEAADGDISFYRQGDFTDLCRGPHLQNAEPIKAVKLLSLAGAYWRTATSGTRSSPVSTGRPSSTRRISQLTSSASRAKRRDHRRLGRELDLVHFDEHSPGSPLWHPRGMVMWNELEDLRRRENSSAVISR